jgi:hypothetical protein
LALLAVRSVARVRLVIVVPSFVQNRRGAMMSNVPHTSAAKNANRLRAKVSPVAQL